MSAALPNPTPAPKSDKEVPSRPWPVVFFGSPLTWLVVMTVVVSFNVVRTLQKEVPEALKVYGTLPDFELQNQFGQNFGTDDLQNKAWVANFIFTRCPTVCPAFTKKMYDIQHRSRGLGDSIRLVSFSVDPQYDTPERLLAYAKSHRYSPRVWSFLTGPLADVKKVVVDGLKMSMGGEKEDGNFEGIFHGSHFVLVDGRGQIRGYYDSNEVDSVKRVLTDAGWLLNLDW